jgi:hypothetical protein
MVLMMSSKAEETSIEYRGLRQGVFSYYLIKGLKGEANSNRDKIVTITELYDYVKKNVRQTQSFVFECRKERRGETEGKELAICDEKIEIAHVKGF